MSNIFCVHIKWVYTVSQGSDVMCFIMVRYIQEWLFPSVPFNALFGLIFGIIILIHVLYVLYISITINYFFISFSMLIYIFIFNNFWLVANFPIYRSGWIFQAISHQASILCDTSITFKLRTYIAKNYILSLQSPLLCVL